MKRLIISTCVAGVLAAASVLPLTVEAGRGRGPRGGAGGMSQNQIQDRDRQRLQDGSCANQTGARTGNRSRKGNNYGPGDGTGYGGVGPKDGSGYGAPTNR